MIIEAEEDATDEADAVDVQDADRPGVTSIAIRMELVRILAASVVPRPTDTRRQLRLTINRAEPRRIVPPDNSGQN